MPVHKGGPRLYRSVPFKHLGKGSATGGSKSQNISLNLVPFVDTMTILVTFLLIVFSSSGELLKAQKGLELPEAVSKDTLQEAPILIITKTDVSFMGTQVATIDSLLRDEPPTLGPEGLAILQADREVDARVSTMVVTTAKYAEFDNLLFAVKSK